MAPGSAPPAAAWAVRARRGVDQGWAPAPFLVGAFRVFALPAQVQGRHLQLQQLGRAADAAQRVLDFMRQVADQLLVDLALVEDTLLAVEF